METKQNSENIMDPVFQLAVSPDFPNDQTCFAAKASGLYRTTDGGQNWNTVYNSLPLKAQLSTSCVALVPDFARSGVVFAAVQGAILKSVDRGETWTVSILPTPAPFVTALHVSPNYAADGVLVAATMDDGILRSSNRGAGWVPWNFGLFDFHVLCMEFSAHFVKDKTIFIGSESGIFKSVNAGLGWQEVPFPIEYAPVISMALSPTNSGEPKILAGTETSGLFVATGQGTRWEQRSPVSVVGVVNGILALPCLDDGVQIVLLSDQDILISTDWAENWWALGIEAESNRQPTAIAVLPSENASKEIIVGYADGFIQRISLP